MRDPSLDALARLRDADDAPLTPLPAASVRRLGERRRRRHQAVVAGGSALAVAAVAGLALQLAQVGQGDAAPPATSPDGTAVLAGVDLTRGMEPWGTGPPIQSARAEGVGGLSLCGTAALPGTPEATERQAVNSAPPDRAEAREVRLYADEATTRDVLDALVDSARSCPATVTVGRGDLPGDAFVVTRTDPAADSAVWWQVTRVGPALVLGSVDTELTADQTLQAAIERDTEAWAPVVAEVCEAVGTACEPPPAPTPTSTPDPRETLQREIPLDLPLTAGFPGPERTEPGDGFGTTGPERDLSPQPFVGCGTRLLPDGLRDRVTARWINPEDGRTRGLLTFVDADAAVAYVDAIEEFHRQCPRDTTSQEVIRRTSAVRPAPELGGQSLAVADGYSLDSGEFAPGVSTMLVVRSGRAVVIDTWADEGLYSDAAADARFAEQATALAPVVAAMCLFTEAGC